MRLKTPTFSLRTLFAVTALLCIAMALGVAFWPRVPSLTATTAVKHGMAEAEVRKILGPPNVSTTTHYEPSGIHTELHYRAGRLWKFDVDIVLGEDGRVVEKQFWYHGKRVPDPAPQAAFAPLARP